MKKSNFLKNSRDMLSRSFNPSKCKTSLRLAGSRLKLLRNKKEVQLKQMKREISQLLESGQDQTARIRVEHVIREEKMMAAYDLMAIYCELIVARLPIIESQKICPIDLKEAIASVVFASPRCGDVPELIDVKKQFTEKYGKDFTTAALELRPECGVSRMLVEKLSAVAPDVQTKTKILSAIAEEHNVKWNPESFEENSVPASDLLTGRDAFGKEHVELSHYEGPDVQVPQSNKNLRDSPLNLTQADNKATERLSSTSTSGINTSFQHEARPPAFGDEKAQLFQGSGNTISLDRPRWNMEFKDATSAAQAAAESAELASMAARAAAQLSSHGRITRQYPTESHKSDANVSKDGVPEAYMNSKLSIGQSSEESKNRLFSGHTRSQNEQRDSTNRKTDGRFRETDQDEYSESTSLKSKASADNDSLDHGVPVVNGYSHKDSLKEVSRGQVSNHRQSLKAERADGWQEKSEIVRAEKNVKRSSVRSSHSSISNDVNIFSYSNEPKFESSAVEDSFSGFEKKWPYGEADSRESATVVFDKSDSDSENHTFDMSPTYDDPKQEFHLPLSGHDHLSTNPDSWSPRSSTSETLKSSSSLFLNRKISSSDFSERSMDGPKPDTSMPATFNESDVPTSDSDEDINTSRQRRDSLSTQNQPVGLQFRDKSGPSVGSSLKNKVSSGFNRKQLTPSFDNALKSVEMTRERSQGRKLETSNSSPESERGLNFERLAGGFRQRGHNHPSFLQKQFDVSLSSSEEGTAVAPPPAIENPRIGKIIEHKKSRALYLQSESDSDSSEEEESLRKSDDHKKEIYTPRVVGKEDVKTKPSLAARNAIVGSDSDEDLAKGSFGRRSHLHSGISRRTKALPSSSNYSRLQHASEEDRRKHIKPEPQQEVEPAKVASNQQKLGKVNARIIPESKVSQKSEESATPQRKTEASLKSSNEDSSNQKASHVHPKLPDYDSLVQSLRKNRS